MADVPTFCALCISRCGATATVENGAFVALAADPDHPTGRALCVKGKASPELVAHPDRLEYPMKRTGPKGGSPDWQRITWDEALDTIAARLRELAHTHGAESVAFSAASPSTSAIADSIDWIQRLRRAFGSPNLVVSMELCGWGRYLASGFTFGTAMPGAYMPDLEHAGCILYWGYNPSVARLTHATATVDARKRGAKLVVVDPRRVGIANQADVWLGVRPGTDCALALSIAHVMIERGWFDHDFVREWTNGPFLVRTDTGRFARDGDAYVTRDSVLRGEFDVATADGVVRCKPAFELLVDACRPFAPAAAEALTGVPAAEIERVAQLLWESRPVAYYGWGGIEQHRDATQIARAVGIVYALTGSFDVRGGNVLMPSVPANPIDGPELLAAEQRAKTLGATRRPLGPARWEFVTSDELYAGALDRRVRGLVGFGANLVLAQPDSARGRAALAALDFYVHADLFMTPTAELADIVLPVASPFESEALKIGFEVSVAAQSLVQLRRPVVAPRGEARSDLQIVFALATRLGLGEHFWNGDIDAAFRHQLAPSGLTLEQLRAEPAGVRVPLEPQYQRYRTRGFGTPTRKIELYSEQLLAHGYAPLPDPPATAPSNAFPLVLTSAKTT